MNYDEMLASYNQEPGEQNAPGAAPPWQEAQAPWQQVQAQVTHPQQAQPGFSGVPGETARPAPAPFPFTPAMNLMIQRLQNGLSEASEAVFKNDITQSLGDFYTKKIQKHLAPLLASQQADQQQKQQQAKAQMMDAAATQFAIEQIHAKKQAQAQADIFPITIKEHTNMLTGDTEEFYQPEPGKWEPIPYGNINAHKDRRQEARLADNDSFSPGERSDLVGGEEITFGGNLGRSQEPAIADVQPQVALEQLGMPREQTESPEQLGMPKRDYERNQFGGVTTTFESLDRPGEKTAVVRDAQGQIVAQQGSSRHMAEGAPGYAEAIEREKPPTQKVIESWALQKAREHVPMPQLYQNPQTPQQWAYNQRATEHYRQELATFARHLVDQQAKNEASDVKQGQIAGRQQTGIEAKTALQAQVAKDRQQLEETRKTATEAHGRAVKDLGEFNEVKGIARAKAIAEERHTAASPLGTVNEKTGAFHARPEALAPIMKELRAAHQAKRDAIDDKHYKDMADPNVVAAAQNISDAIPKTKEGKHNFSAASMQQLKEFAMVIEHPHSGMNPTVAKGLRPQVQAEIAERNSAGEIALRKKEQRTLDEKGNPPAPPAPEVPGEMPPARNPLYAWLGAKQPLPWGDAVKHIEMLENAIAKFNKSAADKYHDYRPTDESRADDAKVFKIQRALDMYKKFGTTGLRNMTRESRRFYDEGVAIARSEPEKVREFYKAPW